MIEENRIPPADVNCEMAVIGAILQDQVATYEAFQRCSEELFYKEINRQIYWAARQLFNNGKSVDIISLADQLNKQGQLEAIGGAYYLTECIQRTPSSANIVNNIAIMRDKYNLRKIISLASTLSTESFNASKSSDELLAMAESEIHSLITSAQEHDFKRINSDMDKLVERLQNAHEHPGQILGLRTGYEKLDQCLNGFQAAQLIILAARTSQGKTALSLDIARNMAGYGLNVGIFSHEMSLMQLQMRMLAANTKIDGSKMRLGYMTTDQWQVLTHAFSWMSKLNVYVDDSVQTIESIMVKARRAKARYKIDLFIVDHMGLVRTAKWMDNRNNQIGYITSSLKDLAKRLDVPILALSQLSRSVDSRKDKIPILSDLRDSGNLEQDADIVMFIHRPEVYGETTITLNNAMVDTKNLAILNVAKQRDGALANIQLYFNKESATFSEQDTIHTEELLW